MIGKTLAHYEITAHLGTGGMGEVYRARDTKLDREVALKVLPTAFVDDTERLARFEREATTLAKLQHANIATIYGFERDVEQPFLVMELVEGEDLAARLQRGPTPPTEAFRLAEQIAEGLEAAHALGVVHRDLKPANIKLTPAGDVKILDFGLARAYAADGDVSATMEISNSPTITAAMTMAGTIIGTAAYMSPEQARGKSIDRQADVWAFGVVLFEMLTGDRLFGGETVSDSIGAILHRDPDLDRLPAVPHQVRTLLRRCLARDKRERLRDIGDARLELADALAGRGAGPNAVADAGRGRLVAAGAALAVVVIAVLGWLAFGRTPTPGPQQTTVAVTRDQAIDMGEGAWGRLLFAPDGRHVVHMTVERGPLLLRDIHAFVGEPIPGTEGASLFDFSPDGRWIVYPAASQLWKVALTGGAPIALCETSDGPGLAWGAGEIFFARNNGGGLWAVAEDGGEPRPISILDDAREETSHRWPSVLPDGRHLLFTIKTARISTFDDALIGLLSLDDGAVRVLIQGGSQPRYAPTGHIVYGRDSRLFAVPFDLESLTVTGTPFEVLDQVCTMPINGAAQYSLSATGNLAYMPVDGNLADYRYTWRHLSGREIPVELPEPEYFEIDISPDGRQLAGMASAANDKIQVYDLVRKTMTRLTNTPGNDGGPCWSPDGTLVAYENDRDGSDNIWVIPVDGSEPARRLTNGPVNEYVEDWTPDGRRILFTRVDAGGNADIWIVPADGGGEAQPLLATESNNAFAAVSPDGRWLAYGSDFSGDFNIYVQPFERPGRAARVSVAGGQFPQWAPDGRTLYYVADDKMMAAPLETDGTLRVGEATVVHEIKATDGAHQRLAPDGERFLVLRTRPGMHAHHGFRVVFDWTERLRDGAR